jgi:hypothetical protein
MLRAVSLVETFLANRIYVGFEGPTAVLMKSSVFWDTNPRSPLKVSMKQVSYLFHADFLIGLFFGPEDGGDMFLRNVG